jgi:hypothetical protein
MAGEIRKFPLTSMGVLAPASAHTRPSARLPIKMSQHFLPHVSAESPSKISPNPSEVISEVSENFRSRRWGSSLTICARLTVRSSPHRHKWTFFGACVCRVTFKHLPQPLRSHILSFGTIGQLFKIPPFSAQKSHSAGGRGDPRFVLGVGILIFLLLRSPCQISKPYDNPFWEN